MVNIPICNGRRIREECRRETRWIGWYTPDETKQNITGAVRTKEATRPGIETGNIREGGWRSSRPDDARNGRRRITSYSRGGPEGIPPTALGSNDVEETPKTSRKGIITHRRHSRKQSRPGKLARDAKRDYRRPGERSRSAKRSHDIEVNVSGI